MYVIKEALKIFIRVVDILILLRILLSFFPNFRMSKAADIIYQLTEPILSPCRVLIDKLGFGGGMFDFSILLAYLILRVLEMLVYSL